MQLEDEVVEIPKLRTDGQNWSIYRERLERVLAAQGVIDYLRRTTTDNFDNQLNCYVKAALASTIPDSLFMSLYSSNLASEWWKTLQNSFEKTTSTATTEPVHDGRSNGITHMAAHVTHE
jgi:hypothetical protein